LKILLSLIAKDLKRDLKRPASLVLYAALPVLMTGLIAVAFGARKESTPLPVIHVAVWDRDQDVASSILRFLLRQEDSTAKLMLHFVDDREQGLKLVEKQKVSALIIIPEHMTLDLVEDRPNTIELYENPAQQYLPKIVRQGLSLLTVGLSGVAEVLQAPLGDIQEMVNDDFYPDASAVAQVALLITETLKPYDTYLFPLLVNMQTVEVADYQVQANLTSNEEPAP